MIRPPGCSRAFSGGTQYSAARCRGKRAPRQRIQCPQLPRDEYPVPRRAIFHSFCGKLLARGFNRLIICPRVPRGHRGDTLFAKTRNVLKGDNVFAGPLLKTPYALTVPLSCPRLLFGRMKLPPCPARFLSAVRLKPSTFPDSVSGQDGRSTECFVSPYFLSVCNISSLTSFIYLSPSGDPSRTGLTATIVGRKFADRGQLLRLPWAVGLLRRDTVCAAVDTLFAVRDSLCAFRRQMIRPSGCRKANQLSTFAGPARLSRQWWTMYSCALPQFVESA